MFQIGEYVVHGNDGICEVKDITQLELPGGSSKRQYYLLDSAKGKERAGIYSPVESSKVQTRKVITKQEADTLIREIPAIQAAWVENEKLRENVYKEAIKSCDLRELVKIIKNMYLRRQERLQAAKKQRFWTTVILSWQRINCTANWCLQPVKTEIRLRNR